MYFLYMLALRTLFYLLNGKNENMELIISLISVMLSYTRSPTGSLKQFMSIVIND